MGRVVFRKPTRRLMSVGSAATAHAGRGVDAPPLEGGTPLPPAADQVEELKKVCLQLPPKQLKKMLDELAASQLLDLSGVSAADRDLGMWAEAVHKALQDCLGSSGQDLPGVQAVRKLLSASSHWAPVQAFMQASKLDQGTVQERQLAYHCLAGLLVRHARGVARHTGAPLVPKFVANCCHNISGVFDEAFPGYVASGLARLVVKRTQQKDPPLG